MIVVIFVTQNNFLNGPGISDRLLGFTCQFHIVCVCMCACVRACVRACVCVCVCVCVQGMEECQVRDLQILDYQKHVEELESRLKIQQNLYEAVHQDRNMYRLVRRRHLPSWVALTHLHRRTWPSKTRSCKVINPHLHRHTWPPKKIS